MGQAQETFKAPALILNSTDRTGLADELRVLTDFIVTLFRHFLEINRQAGSGTLSTTCISLLTRPAHLNHVKAVFRILSPFIHEHTTFLRRNHLRILPLFEAFVLLFFFFFTLTSCDLEIVNIVVSVALSDYFVGYNRLSLMLFLLVRLYRVDLLFHEKVRHAVLGGVASGLFNYLLLSLMTTTASPRPLHWCFNLYDAILLKNLADLLLFFRLEATTESADSLIINTLPILRLFHI